MDSQLYSGQIILGGEVLAAGNGYYRAVETYAEYGPGRGAEDGETQTARDAAIKAENTLIDCARSARTAFGLPHLTQDAERPSALPIE